MCVLLVLAIIMILYKNTIGIKSYLAYWVGRKVCGCTILVNMFEFDATFLSVD
jgi:hypothetical protein